MTSEISANSYGSVEGVAALSGVFTDGGVFNGNTLPTDENVVRWIDQFSGFMNAALSGEGFVTPVTQADAKLALDAIIEQYVADMVMASNSSGRFFSERYLKAGVGPITQIGKDITDWVNMQAGGLEQLGATRRTSGADQIGYRDVDEQGEATSPIFQRKGFGNRFEDWTKR